eukprot:scaffold1600_cov120-Isochrysis_galbana.AAC.4
MILSRQAEPAPSLCGLSTRNRLRFFPVAWRQQGTGRRRSSMETGGTRLKVLQAEQPGKPLHI